MTILIAENEERKLIEQYLPEFKDADVLVTGVGALNVMRALRDLPLDTPLINIGYTGSSNFEIGTLVEVTEARLNHPNVNYPEPVFRLENTDGFAFSEHTKAVCYTGVDFCLQSDYRDCVFDMELAFILGMGFRHVRALKLVSDNLSIHDYRKMGLGVEEA